MLQNLQSWCTFGISTWLASFQYTTCKVFIDQNPSLSAAGMAIPALRSLLRNMASCWYPIVQFCARYHWRMAAKALMEFFIMFVFRVNISTRWTCPWNVCCTLWLKADAFAFVIATNGFICGVFLREQQACCFLLPWYCNRWSLDP